MTKDRDQLDETKRIMEALVRMPPKPHEEMKLGKPRRKPPPSPKKSESVKKPGR